MDPVPAESDHSADVDKHEHHADAQRRYRERNLDATHAKARERIVRARRTPEDRETELAKRHAADADNNESRRRKKFVAKYGYLNYLIYYWPLYKDGETTRIPGLRFAWSDEVKRHLRRTDADLVADASHILIYFERAQAIRRWEHYCLRRHNHPPAAPNGNGHGGRESAPPLSRAPTSAQASRTQLALAATRTPIKTAVQVASTPAVKTEKGRSVAVQRKEPAKRSWSVEHEDLGSAKREQSVKREALFTTPHSSPQKLGSKKQKLPPYADTSDSESEDGDNIFASDSDCGDPALPLCAEDAPPAHALSNIEEDDVDGDVPMPLGEAAPVSATVSSVSSLSASSLSALSSISNARRLPCPQAADAPSLSSASRTGFSGSAKTSRAVNQKPSNARTGTSSAATLSASASTSKQMLFNRTTGILYMDPDQGVRETPCRWWILKTWCIVAV
ncbi:hypothetical protein C8R45DRAFT_1110586 [Mycena sanguinolenta]|nr:hypothetical protein C8R45DRAFT_1110586 [Mycena sanguinolenta]